MPHVIRSAWSNLIALATLVLMAVGLPAQAAPGLTIGNYELVSSKRISRLEFEYTYRAKVTNAGSDALDVAATLTVDVPGVTIVDGALSFGDVAAGATVWSEDTFAIRQNRQYSLAESAFIWDLQVAPFSLYGSFDQNGGVMTVTDPVSQIFGSRVEIPPGAVGEGETVQISVAFSEILPQPPSDDALIVSKVFEFNKDNENDFAVPISITIPLSRDIGPNDIPLVFYWNERYQKYLSVAVTKYDRDTGNVTFRTAHFTSFVAMSIPNSSSEMLFKDIDTGFRPNEDGFYHRNFGTTDLSDGSCLGMAHFVEWYFDQKKIRDGNGLYSKYREDVVDWFWDDVTAREIIARAANVPSQKTASWEYLKDVFSTTDDMTAQALWVALQIEKRPQTLVIGPSLLAEFFDLAQGRHAVSVFRWDSTNLRFEIYDSNHPGEIAFLRWNLPIGNQPGSLTYIEPRQTTLPWDTKNFAHLPSGTHLNTAIYENIYDMEVGGFPNQQFPRIEIIDPVLDLEREIRVSDSSSITVRGKVSDGNSFPRWVHVNLNGIVESIVPISENTREFSYTAPLLSPGSHYLLLRTRDDLPHSQDLSEPFSFSPDHGWAMFFVIVDEWTTLAAFVRDPDGNEHWLEGKRWLRDDGKSWLELIGVDGISCSGEFDAGGTGALACNNGWTFPISVPVAVFDAGSGSHTLLTDGYLIAIGWGADADESKLWQAPQPPVTAGALNDTGVDWCVDGSRNYNDGDADYRQQQCDAVAYAGYPGQDGHYGRDAAARAGTLTKIGGGNAGFDFTKISNSGDDLPASAILGSGSNDWACTRDNLTGLIWEVKADSPAHLRYQGHSYTWYDPNSPDGDFGFQDGGRCLGSACDTTGFVEAVNAEGLCGASDWRMPTPHESQGIVDYSSQNGFELTYFPFTKVAAWYSQVESAGFSSYTPSYYMFWTGSPSAMIHSMNFTFAFTFDYFAVRSAKRHVMLVSGK